MKRINNKKKNRWGQVPFVFSVNSNEQVKNRVCFNKDAKVNMH